MSEFAEITVQMWSCTLFQFCALTFKNGRKMNAAHCEERTSRPEGEKCGECVPSLQSTLRVRHDEQQKLYSCYVSYVPAAPHWNLSTHRVTWLLSEKRADKDRRWNARREKEKRSSTRRELRNEQVSGAAARAPRRSGRQIGVFPPVADYTEYTQWGTGIWQPLTFSPLIIRRHIGSLQEEWR